MNRLGSAAAAEVETPRAIELFIVEGESAAAAIAQVCRPRTQQVHAIQGKPMNVTRASQRAIWANERVRMLHHRVVGSPSAHLVPGHRPIERLVVLTDANVDEVHTKALLVALIDEVMPEIVAGGRLWTIRAPEFAITCAERRTPVFAYSHQGRRNVLAQLAERGATELATQHYAGLAGMGTSELSRAFTEPETRQLSEVTREHVNAARAVLGGGPGGAC